MKLKVCGMKYENNISEVSGLAPDFMGFIFYDKSPRNFVGTMPMIASSIQKVGVFVAAPVEEVLEKVMQHDLQLVQLHGNEDPSYCLALNQALLKLSRKIKIIKVFSVNDQFDFTEIKAFEALCDFYLFDTKGPLPGGNGFEFDWEILKNYPSNKPFLLSGGIGLSSSAKLAAFFKSNASTFCCAIDVNSQFEIEPGLKDIEALKEMKRRVIKN
ncbi:phosphoribosylanthranilate isomerase [Flavobacteriaceae bacterium F08102]|nr:phosphoribosylanthranilate isomerase [Flavobacteriaceae bacterium F08102]